MTIEVVYAGDTTRYVKYETEGMDFSISSIKAKLWIPKEDIQTNIPGVYPPQIKVRIIDNSEELC